ncbi:glycosyltransferase 1 domain-containing protein 1 isoform X3 [Rana temporaria]|uniref:glycosyltransferase 1 domain-containing protein 1 isoform X3 n=1 Tax=Rana temporaria TaxID=8407 RepID=UPI001AAD7B49|nr:glycosyltransferase 1 domain-containing protein 1 isoform X3 [Rana temporaria]
MRILFLAPLRAHTGNSTTALRIKSHLEAAGHECDLRDASTLESPLEVARLISQKKFDAGLVIHLYKAGKLLLGNGIPFGAVFGGTDINEDVKNEEKYRVMGAVLEDARFAVAFTNDIKEIAAKHWPQAIYKIHIQPQGIMTKPNVLFNCEDFLQNAGIQQISEHLHIFILICGLRRVKDPLFLVDTFAGHRIQRLLFYTATEWMILILVNQKNTDRPEWHKREPTVHLAIIGPMVDPLFTNEVKAKLSNLDGVHLIEEIPQADLQAVIKKSFAVVNSSVSEGMSAAILEEFVQMSVRLMKEPDLKRKIIHSAKQYVCTNHSWELERETYQKLVRKLTEL